MERSVTSWARTGAAADIAAVERNRLVLTSFSLLDRVKNDTYLNMARE